jgi:uncharacterized protein Smg (DUF494 family)
MSKVYHRRYKKLTGVYFTEKDFKNILHWHDLLRQERNLSQEDENTKTKLLAFLITTQEETLVSSECNLEAIR